MFNIPQIINQPQGSSLSPWERVGVRLFGVRLFGLFVFLFGIATSCIRNDRDENIGHFVEAVFSAKISLPKQTRASGTMWDSNDEIGIYMLKDGGSLATDADIVANNYLYKIEYSGPVIDDATYLSEVSTDNGGKGAIYMNFGDKYDFIAYYPFKPDAELMEYIYPISLADQHDQLTSAAHDLLYSTANRSNTRSDDVSFVFDHVLTNITINVERGRGINADDFIAKNVVITGMPTEAEFDLKDKTGTTFINLNAVADIESKKSDTDGKLYEVIIIPQAAGTYTSRTISFTVSGTTYQWYIPNGYVYLQGMRYTYNFKLTTSGLELDGDVIIAPWTGGGDLDADDWDKGIAEYPTETVRIPSGSFVMGSDVSATTGENIKHTVNISGFRLSKYEITVAEYCEFLNDTTWEKFTSTSTNVKATLTGTDEHEMPYKFSDVVLAYADANTIKYEGGNWQPQSGRDNYPMARVTWYGAFAYARWADGRLPTEAEWEYASKAGNSAVVETTNYGMGVTSDVDPTPKEINTSNLGDYAWYKGNASGTKQVGQKLPNVWGLHDMHGNVWEWCYDWYSATYYNTATTWTDPVNTAIATNRIIRGGGYATTATGCRSAFRGNNHNPTVDNTNLGFRVVFPL